ncbi:VOC family protein [Kitasatospora terrestris]|uniref:Glyoxalase-like domain-containing protein n=1 Tax=Kitasatospora terrestris TaxID=258051 RepID=A0ABP9DFJ0_9ACTN
MTDPQQTAAVQRIRPLAFHRAGGTEDWRVLGDGACAHFRTDGFAAGARFVHALAGLDLTGPAGTSPDVDLRSDGVTVRLITLTDTFFGLTEEIVDLARRISALAAAHGLTPDPSGVQTVQVTLDALDMPAVVAFWSALLGYTDRAGSPEDLVDPRRRGGPFFFQQMDEPRPQRNRVHVDLWLPYDRAEARIAAALAAGGRLLDDTDAPGLWILSDPEGNEACVGAAGAPAA